MDLNLLRLFVIVADAASFSDAARKLRLPRSSVSRGVAQLERSLGVSLFNRTTRRVAMNAAGQALYARVAPQISGLEGALGSMPEQEEQPSGTLRLTAPTDLGVTFLPEVFAGFSLRYPAVTLDVHLSSQVVDLVGEGFDLAIRATRGRLADSSLVVRRLSEVCVELFASPTYLARRGTPRTIEDTAEHEWVLFRGQAGPAPFPKPRVASRMGGDDMSFVHQVVRLGAGLGLLPVFLARADVASGHLVRVLPRVTLRTGALYFVVPRADAVPRKVVAFRDYLIDYITANPLGPPAT